MIDYGLFDDKDDKGENEEVLLMYMIMPRLGHNLENCAMLDSRGEHLLAGDQGRNPFGMYAHKWFHLQRSQAWQPHGQFQRRIPPF